MVRGGSWQHTVKAALGWPRGKGMNVGPKVSGSGESQRRRATKSSPSPPNIHTKSKRLTENLRTFCILVFKGMRLQCTAGGLVTV